MENSQRKKSVVANARHARGGLGGGRLGMANRGREMIRNDQKRSRSITAVRRRLRAAGTATVAGHGAAERANASSEAARVGDGFEN